jgi:hypothetical protein
MDYMRGISKKIFLFLLILVFGCMVNAAAQGNAIISGLSYERHKDNFLLQIETKEPANIVCHAVKNPPSIIITSPEEIFTNLPERIKIGGSVKSIRSVNGLKKVPEELDKSFYNVSFFVVDLNEPKKFEVTKQETKFLLNIVLKPKAGEKPPIIESGKEKTLTPDSEYRKEKAKKIEAKKSVKEIKEAKPLEPKRIKEEKADMKEGLRDKQMELALENLTKQQKEENSSIKPKKIAIQEKQQPPKESIALISEKKEPSTFKKDEFVEISKTKETVLDDEKQGAKSSSVDMANESIKNILLSTERGKKRLLGIAEESPEKVKTPKAEPKREKAQKITQVEEAPLKDEPRVDEKKLAKIDSAIQELTKKEERGKSSYREKLNREKEPIKEIQEEVYRQDKKELPSSKKYKPSGQAQETVEKLENLKEEINKSIEDRIQAELLKDSSSRRWEGSKEKLDDALSR